MPSPLCQVLCLGFTRMLLLSSLQLVLLLSPFYGGGNF